jgi:L-fuconolactonase
VIVDAHHHLWDPGRHEYPWMTGEAARLREPRVLDDLRAVTGPAGVSATVAVQAATTEAETAWLLALAAESDGLVAGVVGWVDLEAPDADERIAALRAGAGGKCLVGIRHQVHDEPDPEWLDRDAVRRGLRAVAEAGLAYDLLLFPEHLAPSLRLAEAVPELALVVDHGAKPPIASGGWEPWSTDLAALAAHERIHCKLSGLVTEARHDAWREDGVERYAARLLELFGPSRLMFGSDWPVCTLAASYGEVLELAQTALAGCSPDERAGVLGGNAERFYSLAGSKAWCSHASTPPT